MLDAEPMSAEPTAGVKNAWYGVVPVGGVVLTVATPLLPVTVWVVPIWVDPLKNATVPAVAGDTVAVSVIGLAGAVCGLGGDAVSAVVVFWVQSGKSTDHVLLVGSTEITVSQ